MVSNGPGDYVSKGYATMNSQGYVYEMFESHSRQSFDNNDDKPVTWRVGFCPFDGLLIRMEGMQGKYDADDNRDFSYLTSEIFCSIDRFDGMIGLAQLEWDAPADATGVGLWPGGDVLQRSFYVVGGYKIINQEYNINYLQPVLFFLFPF